MLGCGWAAMGAGLLPPLRGRAEVLMLGAYGAIVALLYGALLNMWFWPFTTLTTSVTFVTGDPVWDNLARFVVFHLTTSMAWDISRAVGNRRVCACSRVGRCWPRCAGRVRKAAFDAPIEFQPVTR